MQTISIEEELLQVFMRNWLFVLSSVALSTLKDFIRTRLPVTSCLYTNKNAVPARVHTLKTGDLTVFKKKSCYPGGYVPTVMSNKINGAGGFHLFLRVQVWILVLIWALFGTINIFLLFLIPQSVGWNRQVDNCWNYFLRWFPVLSHSISLFVWPASECNK